MRDEPKTLRASLGAQMKVPALPSYADDKTIMKRAGEILSDRVGSFDPDRVGIYDRHAQNDKVGQHSALRRTGRTRWSAPTDAFLPI